MKKRDFLTGVGALSLLGSLSAVAQATGPRVLRWAELDVAAEKLESFAQAALALKEAVFANEPGVAVYHAVSEADNPGRVHVLEMYDDTEVYEAHVRQPHFQAFGAATRPAVTGKRLYDMTPVKLGAKSSLSASPLVRIAELEIDPAQLQAYEAAVSEEIDTSIQVEPGVLTIYGLAMKGQAHRLRFFEIYADEAAYQRHIASAHFQKYVKTTTPMIRSRRLLEVRPLFLGLRAS